MKEETTKEMPTEGIPVKETKPEEQSPKPTATDDEIEKLKAENERLRKEAKEKANKEPDTEVKLVAKKLKANLDAKFEMQPGDDSHVIFKITDYGAPRNPDLNANYVAKKRVVRVTPEMFLQMFAKPYGSESLFVKVDTPGKLVRLCKNMDEATIKEVYSSQIESAVGSRPKAKAGYVKNLLKNKKMLKVSGGNQHVEIDDFIHIPSTDNYPFNPKDINKMPTECIA